MDRSTQGNVGHSGGRQRAMIPGLVMVLLALIMAILAKGVISRAVILRFAITIAAIFILPILSMPFSRRCPNCRGHLGPVSKKCTRCGFAP